MRAFDGRFFIPFTTKHDDPSNAARQTAGLTAKLDLYYFALGLA